MPKHNKLNSTHPKWSKKEEPKVRKVLISKPKHPKVYAVFYL